jgi:hypothetical protein
MLQKPKVFHKSLHGLNNFRRLNMTNLNIYLDSVELTVQEACPSKNIIPKELYQQFNFRKYDQLEGENSITVLTMQEPV